MQANGARLAEYFFRTGLNPKTNLEKAKVLRTEIADFVSQRQEESDVHPLQYKYEPELIYRYPREDYGETEKFPGFTPMFCFPNDVQFVTGKPSDTFHSFIITESNGSKLYGVCHTTSIRASPEHSAQIETFITDWRKRNLKESDVEFAIHIQNQIAAEKERLLKLNALPGVDNQQDKNDAVELISVLEELLNPIRSSIILDTENLFVPVSIGVVSKWPWYNLLKDWLSLLNLGIQEAGFDIFPFERYVIHLIKEIPLPPPGKLEIAIPFGSYTLYCSRPPLNSCPLIKNFSTYPLFRTMSIENIITLFELLVTEYKVIFFSEHKAMLTIVIEALTGWLYPFYWHHIIIPVLPARLISYLQAPVPYLAGLEKCSFPEWEQDEWRPPDAAVVDIDNDCIDFPPLTVKIPPRERKKLVTALEKHSGMTLPHAKDYRGIPEPIKFAFPDNKLGLCSQSVLNSRKIQDIPISTYYTFRNHFLVEKRYSFNNASTKSFDQIIQEEKEPSSLQIAAESYNSFMPTPRDSTALSQNSKPALDIIVPVPEQRAMSWWEKMTPTRPVSAPVTAKSHSEQVKPKTPTFFERLLSKRFDDDSSEQTKTLDSPANLIASPLVLPSTKHHDEPPPLERVVFKDGHEFRELILAEGKVAGIDEDTSQESEYADRFTIDSISTGEMSRSEVSTIADGKTQIFSRKASRVSATPTRLNSLREPSVKKKTELLARERVKKATRDECHLCNEIFDQQRQKRFMCKNCHMQIHVECLALSANAPCSFAFSEEKISQAFFKVFVALLKNYRNYLKPPENNTSVGDDNLVDAWFRKAQFKHEFDRDSMPFVAVLLETQAFAQFILERIERPETDYEIMVFDESIKRKLNRSRMRFTKEATPFLNESSYLISSIYPITSPNLENVHLVDNMVFRKDPFEWSQQMEIEPRECVCLISEADLQMMRAHTNEIMSKRSALKGKYDFTAWVKSILKPNAEPSVASEFELRLDQILRVVNHYSSCHLTSQSTDQIQSALQHLHEQNMLLSRITDDEHLVLDENDQEHFQSVLGKLIGTLTLYQEQHDRLKEAQAKHEPLVRKELPPLPTRAEIIINDSPLQPIEKVNQWVQIQYNTMSTTGSVGSLQGHFTRDSSRVGRHSQSSLPHSILSKNTEVLELETDPKSRNESDGVSHPVQIHTSSEPEAENKLIENVPESISHNEMEANLQMLPNSEYDQISITGPTNIGHEQDTNQIDKSPEIIVNQPVIPTEELLSTSHLTPTLDNETLQSALTSDAGQLETLPLKAKETDSETATPKIISSYPLIPSV